MINEQSQNGLTQVFGGFVAYGIVCVSLPEIPFTEKYLVVLRKHNFPPLQDYLCFTWGFGHSRWDMCAYLASRLSGSCSFPHQGGKNSRAREGTR